MDRKTVAFVIEMLNDRRGDVEATARYMRDALRIGGLKASRALVVEAVAANKQATYLAGVEAGTVDIYSACPACSGDAVRDERIGRGRMGDVVFLCATCGAQFGRVSEIAEFVQFPLTNGEAVRYFDFTTPKGRAHGWTNEAGRVVQLG